MWSWMRAALAAASISSMGGAGLGELEVLAHRAVEQVGLLETTTPTTLRSESKVRSRMSVPSIRIEPSVTSYSRAVRYPSVVLPDPVSPTTATVAPGSATNEMFCSVGWPSS